jgi:hypothetical protein
MSPPQGAPAFFVNWFDQLGLKGGLQQFHLNGKKRCPTNLIATYSVDYIMIYSLAMGDMVDWEASQMT